VRLRFCLSLALLIAFWPPLVAAAEPTVGDQAATCASVGQAMIALQDGVNAASIAAIKAGSLAQGLANTNPSKNHAYRLIEEDALAVDAGRAKAYAGLGQLLGARFADPGVTNATQAVTDEAKAELQLVGGYSSVTLAYERMENRGNKRMSPLLLAGAAVVSLPLAAGMAAGASGQHAQTSTSSTTSTTVGNQTYSNTTTTTMAPSTTSIAQALAQAQANAQTKASLSLIVITYRPQIETAIYTFNPLIQKWVDACREAKQLPA